MNVDIVWIWNDVCDMKNNLKCKKVSKLIFLEIKKMFVYSKKIMKCSQIWKIFMYSKMFVNLKMFAIFVKGSPIWRNLLEFKKNDIEYNKVSWLQKMISKLDRKLWIHKMYMNLKTIVMLKRCSRVQKIVCEI